jgi:hypothetical protein
MPIHLKTLDEKSKVKYFNEMNSKKKSKILGKNPYRSPWFEKSLENLWILAVCDFHLWWDGYLPS